MLQWNKLKENQRAIVADLRASIQYTPNRETDLLAFMRLYLKEDSERRPALLEDLRRCMDGQTYPNPFAAHQPYTLADVETCDQLLTSFLDTLAACGGDRVQISREIDTLTTALDELNEARGFGLIDDWRQGRLCALINEAEALALADGPALNME